MKDPNENLRASIEAWLRETRGKRVETGLPISEALARANRLRAEIRKGVDPSSIRIDSETAEVFYALCSLLSSDVEGSPREALRDVEKTHELLLQVVWPEDAFGGKEVLLGELAFSGWRSARNAGDSRRETLWRDRFTALRHELSPVRLSIQELKAAGAKRVSKIQIDEEKPVRRPRRTRARR